MKKKLRELIEQRKAKLDAYDAILAKAEAAKRELTKEEDETRSATLSEIKALDAKIKQTREDIEMREAAEREEQELRALTTEPAGGRPRSLTPDVNTDPLSEREQRDINNYSYLRAVRLRLQEKPLDGLEAEMDQEARREARANGATIEGNLAIPQLVLQRSAGHKLETRALTATGQTSVAGDQGGMAIQTNVGSIVERFYARLLVKQMGTRVLDGLQGNILFPRHTTDDQAAVATENGTASVSSSKLSSFTMTPRRVPVVLEISRQLSLQTAPSVESYFRDDLAFQIAKIIDSYCINGSGGGGQPYGLLNIAGINVAYAGAAAANGTNPNGAALVYQDFINLEKLIANANADIGKLGFMVNPKVRAALKSTAKIGSTYPVFVWGDDNKIMGYNTGVSTQVPSNLTKGGSGATLSGVVFGNFDDALIGQWGGLDMLINPYSKDDSGIVRVNAWTFFDFNVRRPLSFAAILDAVAA